MRLNKKGIRTTIVAFVGLAAMIGILVFYLMGEIDTQQLTVALSSVGAMLGVIIGFFAKDQNKSHSAITPPPPPPPPKDDDPDQ